MRPASARGWLAPWLEPFVDNARNPDLRRAQLSFAAAWSAEWGFTVALSVAAFRDRGAVAVGVVAAARLLPSAIAAPLLLPLADRFRRSLLLASVSGVRALMTACAALVVAADGPANAVYAAAVASTVAGTLFRPAHSAFLPSLCQRPRELVGANAVRGMLDSLSVLLGPAAAALLLRFQGLAWAFGAAAAASLISAVLMLRVRRDPPAGDRRRPDAALMVELLRGVRVVRADRDVRVLVLLAGTQAFVRGALTVFSVVVAIDVLRAGSPAVGVLTAAVGAGAVVGSAAVTRLVRTRRLARWFGTGIGMWGLPLALVAMTSSYPMTCLLLGLIGVGNALVDIGLFTLLARLCEDRVAARVFGVLEGVVALAVAAGGLVTPVLIRWLGVRPALVAVGLLAPTVVVLTWARLRQLDTSLVVREDAIDRLRSVPMLRPLSLPLIEELARVLTPVDVAAGEPVFRQGDEGDRYYVIRDGTAEVIGDGRTISVLGPGDGFGEIALLRDVRRTATVRAASPLRLESLGRDSFLRVVTGYRPSSSLAALDVQSKLDRFTPTQAVSRPKRK